ncbi:MAG TPA: hotdog domain-containing protein [Actinomycetota bacterium]|nr:hotdog domain-containing protein [Actinomycetota bacterium]
MIAPGLEETAQQTVTEDMTAAEIGSGDVPVLGTPAVLALVERVAVAAVAPALQPGTTTVGVRVELDHLAATPPGSLVSASARLEASRGRALTFSFEVSDAAGVMARGRHVRVIVVREEFLQGAAARTNPPG